MITDDVPAVRVPPDHAASPWLRLARREETWKTAEILILRHQLAVLQRQQPRRPRLNWADRALLAALLCVIPNARRHRPEGTVHAEADRFLCVHEGSGTQRTYAYLLVDHLRWLERECLAFETVVLRDLERYMGIVGAEVGMPLGEPWRVGGRETPRIPALVYLGGSRRRRRQPADRPERGRVGLGRDGR